MRLIDADELREALNPLVDERHNIPVWNDAIRISLEALDAMPSVEQPVGMTRDDVLAALDALRERLEEQEANWLDDPGQSDWHSGRRYAINLVVQEVLSEIDTLSEDVRVRVTEQAPEQVPLHEVIGRTLPHDPSCDPNLPIVDVKSGARWGVGGWFWTAQPFPHDDATTPWTTLLVQSTGLVAVRPVAEA